ncbi:hypothetical protein [Algoriphagus sp.]|uniref:hypothetical protein n=1 Tax=Algoriphagus sp. TaxID=1872435 RepID=UPI00262E6678|nr:hypothetical protein [Algoriphagus sp.]
MYDKTQTAYCFSTCPIHGKSFNVIDFIMPMEKTDNHQAILRARKLITRTAFHGSFS